MRRRIFRNLVGNTINEKQVQESESEMFFAEQDRPETVTEFHEDIWYMLLDYVMVYDKEDIRFTVKNVTEI